MTRGQFRAWRRRATWAFVFLTCVSTGSAYLGWHAGEESDRRTREAAADTAQRACESAVEGRIVQAQGLDDLRRAALPPDRLASPQGIAFLKQTQPAIDTQLSRAAGRVVRSDPRLPLSETVVAPLRREGVRRCADDRS